MTSTAARSQHTTLGRRVAPLALAAALALLTACGGQSDKAATQTAAKVDKQEITVHQINFVLQQQRNLRPEQSETASRQILERLIDQQLALQKAEEQKLDRDPRVMQQLEAVRREVLARAYVEKLGEGAPKPTAEEIKAYYDQKPALFSQRRVYNLQEIAIEARPDQVPELREKLAAAKNIGEFTDYLKTAGMRFGANQAVRAAEQLPLDTLDTISRMKDGQASLLASATGAQVVVVAGSREQPVAEEQARPLIEQYLLNERRRKLVEEDIKAMRAGAKIEYVGSFASGAASAPGGVTPATGTASAPAAATPAASGGLSSGDINKGLGLK